MLNFKGVDKDEFVEYKGRPLVRQDDEIFYGDLSGDFYVYMMIMGYKDTENGSVPTQIMVQLCESSTKIPKKQKPCNGLKEALEYADAWLTFS